MRTFRAISSIMMVFVLFFTSSLSVFAANEKRFDVVGTKYFTISNYDEVAIRSIPNVAENASFFKADSRIEATVYGSGLNVQVVFYNSNGTGLSKDLTDSITHVNADGEQSIWSNDDLRGINYMTTSVEEKFIFTKPGNYLFVVSAYKDGERFQQYNAFTIPTPDTTSTGTSPTTEPEATSEPIAPTTPTTEPEATSATLSVTAKPTASAIIVDGQVQGFEVYNISGNNFFKLRDLAMAVTGSTKQFEVGWNAEKNAIDLISGSVYTPVGGEMAVTAQPESTTGKSTTSKIYKNGQEIQLTAYNIGGNNYFKLRDIAQAFNIGVTWDGQAQTIAIDTAKDYIPE